MANKKIRRKPHGTRVNIYLDAESMKIVNEIENLSKFVQLALKQAVGLMAWDILHHNDPDTYTDPRKLEDYVDQYNELNPHDELTQKRLGTWPKNSLSKRELW